MYLPTAKDTVAHHANAVVIERIPFSHAIDGA
jgi:hypothetical protein